MNNLIIGDTSQLNHYFPSDYHRISSRNVDIKLIQDGGYDNVYLLFAEQRTFLNQDESFFIDVNVTYTLKIIDEIKDYVNRIVVFSTSELWNDCVGGVTVNDDYKYNYSPYIKSKEILCNNINEFKDKYENVNIIYPFNFNSPNRKSGFLFSKIYDSLINKQRHSIGDINFNRDIVHPEIIVKNSILTNNDMLVGTGELINVLDFTKTLFNLYNMNFDDYISINSKNSLPNVRKEYYSKIKFSSKEELINLTINDL